MSNQELIGLNEKTDRDRLEILCSEKGQSSSITKQINMEEEDGGGCNPLKRTRSVEDHNQKERIRRQNVKDRIKTLRNMIPNCNKRDKCSTLDDVTNYIKVLQNQVQIISRGVGYNAAFQSLSQRGIQTPNTMLLQTLLQTAPPRVGMEFNMGMGMGMFSTFNFPVTQSGSQQPSTIPTTSSGSHSITQGDTHTSSSSEGAPYKDCR